MYMNSGIGNIPQKQTVLSQNRDSNIELFRIITMFFIVAHHYVVNSGLTSAEGPIASDPMSWRSIFLLLFGAWGKIGINCFVLITGYFMCKSNITLKKFVKLFCEIMFYKIVIGSVFFITGYEEFTIKAFAKMFLPVSSVQTNFTGCYILFFLFIPFLNVLVNHLTEKQHILLLFLCSFTYIFFGTIKLLPLSMNYVSWFIVLYFISSYIRLYPKKIFTKTKVWAWLSIVCIVLCSLSVVCCTWLGARLSRYLWYFFVTDSNTILAVFTGICSFMLFKNLKIQHNSFINAVASTTFGILLIHANCDAMRRLLWQDVFRNVNVYSNALMPLYALGSVVVVFCACAVIDYIRITLIEKPFMKKFSSWEPSIIMWWKRKEEKLCSRFHIQND